MNMAIRALKYRHPLCGRLTRSLIMAACSALPVTVMAQDYDQLIQQAITQRNQGELQAAEQSLLAAYPIPPNKSEVSMLLAMVIAFQARYQEAIELLDSALAEHPDDIGLRLGKARVRAFQGLFPEAAELTADVSQQHPDNIEALNLAGRIALYQQRPAQAVTYFERARALDSEELEVWVGLHDARAAQGQENLAQEALATAALLAPDHIDVRLREERSLSPPGPVHELIAGFDNSRFRNTALNHWRDQFVEYRRQRSLDSAYYLRAENNNRFDNRDTVFEAGWLGNQQGSLPWQFSAAISADTEFSARYRLRGAATVRLNEGNDWFGATLLTPSLQYADYNSGSVARLGFDLEHYVAGTSLWLTPGLGLVRDEDGDSTLSWALGVNWQISGSVRAGVTYSDGAETENGITTDTRARSAYVLWQLAPAVALRLNFGRHDRRNSYSRENAGVSISYRY
jgi:YaiO family outer membrane protein